MSNRSDRDLSARRARRENHRIGVAIAVDQREAAVRLRLQRRLDDGQHRRDARAAGKGEIAFLRFRGELRIETTRRRPDLQLVAGFHLAIDKAGKPPIGDLFDRDPQTLFLRRGADGIAAAQLFLIGKAPQGHMLALRVAKCLAMLVRHVGTGPTPHPASPAGHPPLSVSRNASLFRSPHC